ncbi:hypothetical protein ACEU6E_01970 [Halorutilales archaeon Cl-col2-1]
MKQKIIATSALVILLMSVMTLPAVSAQENSTDSEVRENSGLSLGHQIQVVVESQRSKVVGDIEREVFKHSVENASNKSRVVNQKVEEIHKRTTEAEHERQRLLEQLHNGSIQPQEFAVKMSDINNQISVAARDMRKVNETIQKKDINNVSREEMNSFENKTPVSPGVLRTANQALDLALNAVNMSGQEIAQKARNIGGQNAPEDLITDNSGKPNNVSRGVPSDEKQPSKVQDQTQGMSEAGELPRGQVKR